MHEAHDEQPKVSQILELIALTDYEDSWFERAEKLARRLEEPDSLITLAARHKMLPMLAQFYRSAALMSTLPDGLRDMLDNALAWNRYRVEKLRNESLDIAGRCEEQGVRLVFNKGIALQHSLYDSRGVRSFADIDLMVHPDDASAVREVLQSLDYLPEQKFDPDLGRLIPLPRRTVLLYQINPDHLPHFNRIDPESGIPFYEVDVAMSLTWQGSGWQVSMDEVMGSARPTRVGLEERHLLPTLGDDYALLFVVLHLFRDCWFEPATAKAGPRISQFADIWRYWQRWGRDNTEQLRTLIGAHELEPAVAWIAHYVDFLFGSTMIDELGLREFCTPDWLHSASAVDGRYLTWDGDIRGRLYSGTPSVMTPGAEPPYGAQARGRAS
jgi:hypothetical protein